MSTSHLDAEVLIVGAGPAGIAAAITLRAAGHDCLVLDKSTFPRDKTCGDGLTAGCLRRLEQLGLDPRSIPSWRAVSEVTLHPPHSRPITYPFPGRGIYAASAARWELDLALVELAVNRGVRVSTGCEVTGVRLRDDHVEVETPQGIGRAQFLIAADGMWSPVRRQLGLRPPQYRGEWHAFRQYFDDVSPTAASELHVWFEPDLLPGYVWSFPLGDGRANLGFGVWRADYRLGDMTTAWRDILTRPSVRAVLGPDARPRERHRAWPIPARLGELPLVAHRTMFVGDAAAACDPMTGEGIGQALETGMEAANAITSTRAIVSTSSTLSTAGGDAHAATSEYRRRIEAGLARDMRLAARLGSVLAEPRWAELSLRTTALTGWTRRNFVRWLFEDYPRAILTTPRRWTRDTFTRPGAYQDLVATAPTTA